MDEYYAGRWVCVWVICMYVYQFNLKIWLPNEQMNHINIVIISSIIIFVRLELAALHQSQSFLVLFSNEAHQIYSSSWLNMSRTVLRGTHIHRSLLISYWSIIISQLCYLFVSIARYFVPSTQGHHSPKFSTVHTFAICLMSHYDAWHILIKMHKYPLWG